MKPPTDSRSHVMVQADVRKRLLRLKAAIDARSDSSAIKALLDHWEKSHAVKIVEQSDMHRNVRAAVAEWPAKEAVKVLTDVINELVQVGFIRETP